MNNTDVLSIGVSTAIKLYEERDALRCIEWKKTFSS